MTASEPGLAMARESVALVLAAAGTGSRFGGERPKQFLTWSGRSLYLSALEPFLGVVQEVVVVVPAGWLDVVRQELSGEERSVIRVVPGGATRQASVERGLKALSPSIGFVLVHDAARPFLSGKLVRRVIEGTRRFGACIPGLRPADTVKRVAGAKVLSTLEREEIRLAQTPQGFETGLLARALARAGSEGFIGTDEASLVERCGTAVHVIEGETENVKITWPGDLVKRPADAEGKEDPCSHR